MRRAGRQPTAGPDSTCSSRMMSIWSKRRDRAQRYSRQQDGACEESAPSAVRSNNRRTHVGLDTDREQRLALRIVNRRARQIDLARLRIFHRDLEEHADVAPAVDPAAAQDHVRIRDLPNTAAAARAIRCVIVRCRPVALRNASIYASAGSTRSVIAPYTLGSYAVRHVPRASRRNVESAFYVELEVRHHTRCCKVVATRARYSRSLLRARSRTLRRGRQRLRVSPSSLRHR